MGLSPFFIPQHLCHLPWWQGFVYDETDKSSIAEITRNSYKIGMQFGHLMIVLAWWNSPTKFLYSIRSGSHNTLWPQAGPIGNIDSIDSRAQLDPITHLYIWLLELGVIYGDFTTGTRAPTESAVIKVRLP